MRWRWILVMVLLGCTPPDDVGAAQEPLVKELVGFALFVAEDFDGNGRRCETCHVIGDGTQLSIQQVENTWLAFGAPHPLFRGPDADVPGGMTWNLFRGDALARVSVPLASNVTAVGSNIVGQTAMLRRSTPPILNVALQDHLMWDGRAGGDLESQARAAVNDHFEPGRQPTSFELEAIAAFQRTVFSSNAMRTYANGGALPSLPAGTTASEQRGRQFFLDTPLSASQGLRGACATCHSGPMMNVTNRFNPGDPPGLRFAGNGVSEVNERGLPVATYTVALPQDLVVPPGTLLPVPPGTVLAPAGTPFTFTTADPGALVVDLPGDSIVGANPCISVVPCANVLAGLAPQPPIFHRIASLRGAGRTAPYFHDNSAETTEEVALHYRGFFAQTIGALLAAAAQIEPGDPTLAFVLRDIAAALELSDQDVADIAAYLRLL